MRKKFSFMLIVCLCVFMYLALNNREDFLNERITYIMRKDGIEGAVVLNSNSEEFIPNCDSIKLLNSEEALLGQYDKIVKYSLTKHLVVDEYCIGRKIDCFTIKDSDTVSFSFDNCIEIMSLSTKERRRIVEDNDSKYHGWIKDVLVYSNSRDEIIELDVNSKSANVILRGREPIVSKGGSIAYMNDGRLSVFDKNLNRNYSYVGSVYNYGFAGSTNVLLVEDEMKWSTALKNLLLNKRVKGHRIVEWDYKTDKIHTLLNECEAGVGKGF